MSSSRWNWKDANGVVFAASRDEIETLLLQNRINGSTLIYKEGTAEWKPLETFAEFASTKHQGWRSQTLPGVPPAPSHPPQAQRISVNAPQRVEQEHPRGTRPRITATSSRPELEPFFAEATPTIKEEESDAKTLIFERASIEAEPAFNPQRTVRMQHSNPPPRWHSQTLQSAPPPRPTPVLGQTAQPPVAPQYSRPPTAADRSGRVEALQSPPTWQRVTPAGAVNPLPPNVRISADKTPTQSTPTKAIIATIGSLLAIVAIAFFVGRKHAANQNRNTAKSISPTLHSIETAALAAMPKACRLKTTPTRWSPRVATDVPVSLQSLSDGTFAIGFARDGNEAVTLSIRPTTGEIVPTYSASGPTQITRVTPLLTGQTSVTTTEDDRYLPNLFPVVDKTPFVLGFADRAIITSENARAAREVLWRIEDNNGPDAYAIQNISNGYIAIFRQKNAIWMGQFQSDRKPVGDLVQVEPAGSSVGKPVIGSNGKEIAIVFAERKNEQAPWRLRLGHFPVNQLSPKTSIFEAPPGGVGGDVFAPAIGGLADGRWVIAWTEGKRQVRIQTLSSSFQPIGSALSLSPPQGKYGQPVIAVNGNYVSCGYMSIEETLYELWGSIIACD